MKKIYEKAILEFISLEKTDIIITSGGGGGIGGGGVIGGVGGDDSGGGFDTPVDTFG